VLLRRGQLLPAMAAFDEAEARWSAVGQNVPSRWARSGWVLAAAWAGDKIGAVTRAEPLARAAPRGMRMLEPEAQRALAWAAVAAGDALAARHALDTVAAAAFEVGDVLHGVEAAHDLARVGDPMGAVAHLSGRDLSSWPVGQARADHAQALADEAVEGLAAAGARLADRGAAVEAAEAYADAAAILRKSRHASAADRMAATAARVLRDCGAVATPR